MSDAGSPRRGPQTETARTEPTLAPTTTRAADAPSKGSRDVVLLGPKTADGEGIHVLRARDEKVELGELRELREGRPITGEIVSLEPRKEMPLVCDVRESWRAPTTGLPAHKGPARVATQAYRDGWDDIFGAKAEEQAVPGRDVN